MTDMTRISDGIQILMRYISEEEQHVAAEHDVLYVGGPKPNKISAENLQLLEENGWYYDTVFDCWGYLL